MDAKALVRRLDFSLQNNKTVTTLHKDNKENSSPFIRKKEEFGVWIAKGSIRSRRKIESANDGDR